MSRLRKLRRSGHWEIDLIATPDLKVAETELRGVLMVMDRTASQLRYATPVQVGADLGAVVAKAALQPLAGDPARPRTIQCRASLRSALEGVAEELGATLQVVQELPALDQAEAAMLAERAPLPPMVPRDPEPWRPLLGTLFAEAPWETLSDSVEFRFQGGGALMDPAVALVLGQAGSQLGLVMYPTEQDHERFRAFAWGVNPASIGPWRCWCMHLDPVAGLSAEQRLMDEKAGLVVEGHGLLLFAISQAEVRSLEPEEEQACLAAAQGVLAAWQAHGELLEYRPQQAPARTVRGELMVWTEPGTLADEDDLPLVQGEHIFAPGTMTTGGTARPALFLKQGKREAVRLAEELDDIDGLSFEPDGSGETDVVLWSQGRRKGLLTTLTCHASALDQWRKEGAGVLVIAAGGPRRPKLRSQDILAVIEMQLRGAEEDAPADPAPEVGMLDLKDLEGATWTGPPETWPKASTVLLVFAEPLELGRMPADAFEKAAHLAATVWSAVVLADTGTDPSLLPMIRAQVAEEPDIAALVEQLIQRKRKRFPKDTRVMVVDSCNRRSGRVDLHVKWGMP